LAQTTINASVASTDTTLTVVDATWVPTASRSGQFRIIVGAERMLVQYTNATTLTLVGGLSGRGIETTTAATHSVGDGVYPVLTSAALNSIPNVVNATITVGFDGAGSVIAAGKLQDVIVPATGTITRWTLLADQSGSAVVDIWKTAFSGYPPTVTNTITASAKPTLSSAVDAQSSTLTGWTTAVTAGDTLRFHIDSAATITRLLIVLDYTKS